MVERPDAKGEAEDLVRILSAGLGLESPMPPIPDEVVELARAGRTAEAVRELRDRAPGRLTLRSAKRMVDALG